MSEPVIVGMGVTEHVGSDRYPFTVVRILSPKRIVVQRDQYKRTDNNGMSESQTYEFTPDPNGAEYILTLRRNGRWVKVGEPMQYGRFGIGYRNAYQDPSF